MSLSLLCLHTRELSRVLEALIRARILFRRLCPQDPITSQRPHFLIPLHWGLGFHIQNAGEPKHPSHSSIRVCSPFFIRNTVHSRILHLAFLTACLQNYSTSGYGDMPSSSSRYILPPCENFPQFTKLVSYQWICSFVLVGHATVSNLLAMSCLSCMWRSIRQGWKCWSKILLLLQFSDMSQNL